MTHGKEISEMQRTLVDGEILLRAPTAEDATSLLAAVRESIDTVGRWMSWCTASYSLQDAEEWIERCAQSRESGPEREFSIFEAKSGELLGCAGLNQFNRVNNFANLGYWVRASRVRRGIASRAALLLAKFGFGELELSRIEIVTLVDNVNSRRVAEKVGGRFEGIARNRLYFKEEPRDAALYSLIPSDFAK